MTASIIDGDGFRANIGIILVNDDGQVFWGKRVGQNGWQFPQGGLLEGESPEDALFRELEEEVGLTRGQVEVLGRTKGWLRYRLPPRYRRHDTQPLCVGQKQVWFLLRLKADECMLCLDGGATPEFDDWRWVDFWSPPGEVIHFKRRVYERALEELAPLLRR